MIKQIFEQLIKTKAEIIRDNQILDKKFAENEANFQAQQKIIEKQRHNFEMER